MTARLVVKKCIFGVSKSGTPYHYFRDVKTIARWGLYHVEEVHSYKGDEFSSGSTFLWNKEELEYFNDIISIIAEEEKKILRDWKIKKIIIKNE